LGGLARDLRTLVRLALDAGARLILPRVAHHVDGDADLAQLVLVALEHALERLVAVAVVAGHGLPDLLGRQRTPGGEQADHEIQQPLGLTARHPLTPPSTTLPCPRDQMAQGRGRTDPARVAGSDGT